MSGLHERERLARLVGGSMIAGIAFTGGFKSQAGRVFVTILGVAALFEGLVNMHLTEYFRRKV